MLTQLLPPPVLAIGVSGHRNLATDPPTAAMVEKTMARLFGSLQQALVPAIAQEKNYFSAAPPMARLICMGAEGADLIGARAATRCGVRTCFVIPFFLDEYRNDFLPELVSEATETIRHGDSLLELPGKRDDGPRAYERANEIILSNIDLLIAAWDGKRAHGRAGTGDVVQGAIERGLKVIVIDPQLPETPMLIATPPKDDFELPHVSDLPRLPLPSDLTTFVHDLLRPPPRQAGRRGLDDLIAEDPKRATWRFEYPLLLKIVARTKSKRAAAQSGSAGSPANDAVPSGEVAAAHRELAGVAQAYEIIDTLAVRYGRLFRSSSVARFLGSWIAGIAGSLTLFFLASIVVGIVINALILLDAHLRERHRWRERWLDYRVLAEQLRWLRFRYLFGLGAAETAKFRMRKYLSWTEWYVQRISRALGPPQGRIDHDAIAAAAQQLIDVEIPEQISYHRFTARQLSILERRLVGAAKGALISAIVVAVLLVVEVLQASTWSAVGWKPYGMLILGVLPITVSALYGLRSDADLLRLIERSVQAVALLFRIKRVILADKDDYDHLAASVQRLASMMANELAEWRFVIESRRSRAARFKLKKRRRKWIWLRKTSAAK
jgi:hypothetical protein